MNQRSQPSERAPCNHGGRDHAACAPEFYQKGARNLQGKIADEENSCAQAKHVVAESQVAGHAQRRISQVRAIYVVNDVQNENEG